MWKGVMIGFVAAVVLFAVGAYVYFGFGLEPVGTASPPMPFEKFLANRALHAAIAKAGDKPSPVDATEPIEPNDFHSRMQDQSKCVCFADCACADCSHRWSDLNVTAGVGANVCPATNITRIQLMSPSPLPYR